MLGAGMEAARSLMPHLGGSTGAGCPGVSVGVGASAGAGVGVGGGKEVPFAGVGAGKRQLLQSTCRPGGAFSTAFNSTFSAAAELATNARQPPASSTSLPTFPNNHHPSAAQPPSIAANDNDGVTSGGAAAAVSAVSAVPAMWALYPHQAAPSAYLQYQHLYQQQHLLGIFPNSF